ncbi:1-acyl-sn-glycerol-3-phosphate acyltransferase [Pedobacter steynii]|uniref:1-acyl-sn-glycerol-3-phosphate acyltransferase n=1 Tax=Pedobacter steynii TaxID=430522 RepID=A0A1H0F714_9SPHI|nr:lysophospholipid acyltransferase family protein [Pedobacter steynii]NQX42192.1 1-acyl-sn-glycerol-3-phosphate acyltransferase [Pedobacter steynii]SDN90403.1 1-acyl-sn-glycerol-3-phosphate acyltransferase [Pedobacter steynii]
MNKFFGYIFSPLFYLFFGLTLIIFQPIQWLCYRMFGYQAHKASVDGLNFFLTYCDIFLGSSVTFINEQNIPVDQPKIFVANHQSMYDIPGLIWFLRKHHIKFISKIELTKGIPSISFNLKYGGGANIDRKDSKQAVGEIILLGNRMKENNWSAMIFPEGTRSKDGNLKPFHIGGIATLLKKVPNALIVPIAIENSWKMVQYGTFPLSFGEKIRWTVLKPIDSTGKNPEEVTQEAEQAIRKKLGQ